MTNQVRLTRKSILRILLGWVLIVLVAVPSTASSFNPNPIYDKVLNYTTTMSATGSLTGFDVTDIYAPQSSNPNATFPIALMLQGAFVDKSDYSNFATLVARYGFTVVVPNHRRTVIGPDGPVTNLVVDVDLLQDVLDFMNDENFLEISPIQGKVNTAQMGLLGHSLGGFVGLSAVQGLCIFPFCATSFTRPKELRAGIFYGTSFRDRRTGEFFSVDNQGIPTGLIAGDKDGVALLSNTQGTYEQIKHPPKLLVTVEGANHYGITNKDNLVREQIRPTLPQKIATETIARWSALFLRTHVLGDRQAFNYIYNSGDVQDKNVTVVSARVPKPLASLAILIFGTRLAVTRLSSGKYLGHKLVSGKNKV